MAEPARRTARGCAGRGIAVPRCRSTRAAIAPARRPRNRQVADSTGYIRDDRAQQRLVVAGEPRDGQPGVLQLLGEMGGRRFACPAARDTSTRPNVNTAAKKSAGRDHDCAAVKRRPSRRLDAMDRSRRIIEHETSDGSLNAAQRGRSARAELRTARRYSPRSHCARGAHTAAPLPRFSIRN